MIGLILAAGKGTRLRPLTYAIPKPLLPVGGKPALEYSIDNLSKVVDKIYVAVSYKKEMIEDYLSMKDYGLEVELVTTLCWETGGDLKLLLEDKEIDEDVFVAYGDIISPLDLGSMLRVHREKKAEATLALFHVAPEEKERFGIASLDENSRITQFVEKPKQDVSSSLAHAGYYILSKEAQELLPLKKDKVEYTLFPSLVKRGRFFGHVCNPSYWIDIGTLDSYAKANALAYSSSSSSFSK